MHPRTLALVVGFLLGAARAEAQSPDSTTETPDHWLIGVSLGIPGYRSNVTPELLTFGLNFTQVRPGRIGGDIAIGTMPWLMMQGVVPYGLRGDVALPLVRPHLIVLPSAGVSAVGVIGPGGGAGTLGLNAGLATVLHTGGVGLRTGVTFHTFQGFDNPIWLLEVGFVSVGFDPP